MMRNPFARMSARSAEDDALPACRSYRSLSDAAMQPRRPRLTRVVVAGLGAAAVVLGGAWVLRTQSPAAHHFAAQPYAAQPYVLATVAPATSAATTTPAPAPTHAAGQPTKARFQVAGVSVTASRNRAIRGVQTVAISPGVSRAHAASVESAVLHNLVTRLASAPRFTATRYRHHHATREQYVKRRGVAMTALCVRWNAHTAYLLRAPSGKTFTALLRHFQPR